jgi:LacI family transcriptional regulator, repressor for deo operon, udp, cdd, tsx, nupC, and nupG
MYDPALTTVLQPRAELGRRAADNLVRRMDRDAPAEPPRRTRIPCTLVIRDSVAPPAVSDTAVRVRRAEASR